MVTALAAGLAGLALLDLLLGRATSWRRVAPAAVAATAVAAVAAYAGGCTLPGSVAVAGTVAAEVPLWALARWPWRPRLVLAGLVVALAARFATAGLWTVRAGSPWRDLVGRAPFALAHRVDAGHVAYVVAAVVFLATAGNTLVRLLLTGTHTLGATEKPPGGGRIIGSLERVLIFALAVGGEATAATLVISAKGVLRFAEVRATDGDHVDAVTEYVLVGSLASYALALAFVPFALP
ncbi:MAG TPA: hypothetical protein VFQ85_11370 [Mycobacteriales bacterium]|jgi:hypothetical protein|nr:hypothetical protein [Mycobacteriales bacterium]